MKDLMLKMGVLGAVREKGVDGFYDLINSEEESRKIAKEHEGENYNELYFQCGRVNAKLNLVHEFLTCKTCAESMSERQKLAEILIETAQELRNIKDTNIQSNKEFNEGDIVEYIGDEWADGIENPCKILNKSSWTGSYVCIDKNGMYWFLKEKDLKHFN